MRTNTKPIKSFRALRKLRHKFADVQITKAGGFFRARFNGHANSVFGQTREEAEMRLLSERNSKEIFLRKTQ